MQSIKRVASGTTCPSHNSERRPTTTIIMRISPRCRALVSLANLNTFHQNLNAIISAGAPRVQIESVHLLGGVEACLTRDKSVGDAHVYPPEDSTHLQVFKAFFNKERRASFPSHLEGVEWAQKAVWRKPNGVAAVRINGEQRHSEFLEVNLSGPVGVAHAKIS